MKTHMAESSLRSCLSESRRVYLSIKGTSNIDISSRRTRRMRLSRYFIIHTIHIILRLADESVIRSQLKWNVSAAKPTNYIPPPLSKGEILAGIVGFLDKEDLLRPTYTGQSRRARDRLFGHLKIRSILPNRQIGMQDSHHHHQSPRLFNHYYHRGARRGGHGERGYGGGAGGRGV